MATITPIYPKSNHSRERIVQWAMGDDDTGVAWDLGPYRDISVQTSGTFVSSTTVWQGSNDGTSWVTLTDYDGNALSFTALALKSVRDRPKSIRPVTSGGASDSVLCTVAACS